MSRDRKRRQTAERMRRRRKQALRAHTPPDTHGMWIRDAGLLPSAGVIVDFSAADHLDLAGLGLVQLNQRADPSAPLPELHHLAADISDPYAVSINGDAHATDHGRQIMHAVFGDRHRGEWLTAIGNQHHAMLTVGDCARILAASTSAEVAAALEDAWVAIIGVVTYAYPDGIGYYPATNTATAREA